MKNLGLSKFVSFVSKYGDEAQMVGRALRILAHPFLDPREREAIDKIVTHFEAVGDNISKALPELQKASAIRIDRDDIKDAVRELLPDIVAAVVKEQAKDATN